MTRQQIYRRKVNQARRAILSGSIEPKVRPVSKRCKCAYRTAQAILSALVDDGVLERAGRGWKVRIQPTT